MEDLDQPRLGKESKKCMSAPASRWFLVRRVCAAWLGPVGAYIDCIHPPKASLLAHHAGRLALWPRQWSASSYWLAHSSTLALPIMLRREVLLLGGEATEPAAPVPQEGMRLALLHQPPV